MKIKKTSYLEIFYLLKFLSCKTEKVKKNNKNKKPELHNSEILLNLKFVSEVTKSKFLGYVTESKWTVIKHPWINEQ